MQQWTKIATIAGLACLVPGAFQPVMAHGEVDEEMLAEFQDHMDDFREEVEELVAEAEAIVAGYATRETGVAQVEELVHHWEEVAIHSVIEVKAPVMYPDMWQATAAFQQSVADGQSAESVAAAAEVFKATLWQSLGAVRLAASQVGTASSGGAPGAAD